MPRRDSLRDDPAASVLADVDHLGSGVRLLTVVRERYRVKLADRIVALQDAARILPRDRRPGLHLRPRNLRIDARAFAALGDEVVYAPAPLLVARVPVLHRRVFDLRVVQRDQLAHGGVPLVLIELCSWTA